MELMNMPPEILLVIVHQIVLTCELHEGLRVRAVNRKYLFRSHEKRF
jgi:hypothetical protein